MWPGECIVCEVDIFGASHVSAIDLDPKMVAKAQRRLAAYGERVSLTTGDVTHLHQPDSQFDAVFNFAVLHHVADWKAALGEISRVLAPGGRFYSQDHDVRHHDWLSRHLFEHPSGGFTNAQFLGHLTFVGLEVIGVEDSPGQLLITAVKRP